MIKSIRTVTNLPLDVHLMTYNPQDYLDVLESISVQYISFHVEAVPHLDRMIQNIKGRNIKAGIALNPGTPIGAIEEVLPLLDYVLIMSVNPGFGGQKFIPYTVEKSRSCAQCAARGDFPPALRWTEESRRTMCGRY